MENEKLKRTLPFATINIVGWFKTYPQIQPNATILLFTNKYFHSINYMHPCQTNYLKLLAKIYVN
jgi:hypothetical protein